MDDVKDATALVAARRTQAGALQARHEYHEALSRAHRLGFTAEEIADALNTNPLYIANTLRLHAERRCGCES